MKIAHLFQGSVYAPRGLSPLRDERSSRVLSTFSFALPGLDSFCLITQGGARFTRLPWAYSHAALRALSRIALPEWRLSG
jgi:hypothetical protein